MSARWTPLTPDAVPARIAAWLADASGVLRVVIDGPDCAEPDALAGALIEPLRSLGRPAVHIRARDFWRDASLRLEFGHEDVESFRSWVDADALRREVLEPAVAQRRYLPSLRDPVTNRSTRAAAQPLEPSAVVIVSGALLLGRGLPFDRVIHLAVSAPARVRRTPADRHWTLPAYDEYHRTVRPMEIADVVIKMDDPRHPAVRCQLPCVR